MLVGVVGAPRRQGVFAGADDCDVFGVSHLASSRHYFVFHVEDALGDYHFEFVDLGVAGVFVPFLVEAVKNLGTVQVNLQAALVGGGKLDGNVAGVLGTPEFGRQPRGEAVIASRHAIDDIDFHFAEV